MDYDGIDESYNTDAENVIADYDDYPQYDYDGDYEEELTGSGGPDYGQYYDYDYDSRNQEPAGRDVNDENEIYDNDNEEESLSSLEEDFDRETHNERVTEETRGQGENGTTEETSNHELSSTTSTAITTLKSITTTKSTTTTRIPKTTEATTVSTFYKTFF